ncbi:MAG: bifunctional [glutamate--ammonia ligase]-adenylyl-L-tyrosine phosphorylase/[glutamate--ammonia-ligase] adenylyltransferase, partial [Thermodesulfobacteriota bacterium]
MYEKILDIEEESAIETLTTFGFDESKRALKNLTRIAASPLRDGVPLLLELASHAPSPDDALNNLERIAPLLSPESASSLLRDREKIRMLITVCGSSEMLTHTIVKEPTLLDRLLLGNQIKEKKEFDLFKEEIEQCMGENTESDEAARLLRLYRQREYLRIGARDLLTLSPLRETTAELSALADALLKVATDFCLKKLKEKYGTPLYRDGNGGTCEAEFVVIGMGKLGGMELNFSSDIDIIYLYSYDKGETSGTDDQGNNSIALHTFFVRLSEMVTKMIGAVTEDGYVFRVDLDLRPEGTRGAIANSLRGAEIYYESWGQSWERAAMIKARPVAGSLALGEEFLKVIEPFVYRRYLDFTALDEIRAMEEKIDLNHLRRKRERTDVKLG